MFSDKYFEQLCDFHLWRLESPPERCVRCFRASCCAEMVAADHPADADSKADSAAAQDQAQALAEREDPRRHIFELVKAG
nr:unnamed protein product [Callosobruchus chinensis]